MNNFKFKAQEDGVHLYFYGDIVGNESEKWSREDTAPAEIRDALKQEGKVTLHMNSGGGDVFAAVAICNMLKDRETVCYIDGLAASAASLIALSCKRVFMPENSMIMIHKARVLTEGNAEELLEMAAVLEKIDGQMLDVYASHGTGWDVLADMMAKETWLTAEESAGYFDNVERVEPLKAVAKVKLPKNAPESIQALMASPDNEAEELRTRLALYNY